MPNFWKKLKKPFFCLAPMADVTDFAFRKIISKYGKPDVFWTEFVSADGLAHPKGREKLMIDLKFSSKEHPIVAQIFGKNSDNIYKASRLCQKLGFDGIDINMGCPDKTIEKQGAGASMIKNIGKAREVIRSAKKGAPKLPISVKTRIGYNKDEIDVWIRELLKENLSALTIHLRTRKEMSLVPAHWDLMPKILKLRDEISPKTLIIGNGDALSIEDAKDKIKKWGGDGVMLGRAIFGNPFLFNKKKNSESIESRLKVMVEHTKLFEKSFKGVKSFNIMKKHYKAYITGFAGAKELRMRLMNANTAKEVESMVNDFLSQK